MCKIYEKQLKIVDLINVLVGFAETVDTKFLLDSNERTQEIKRALAGISNEYGIQLVKDGDTDTAKLIFESGIVLLDSLPQVNDTTGVWRLRI